MYISKESPAETRNRLLKIISLTEFSVLDGAYSFEEFAISELSRKIRSDALALVRDDSRISQLVPSDYNSNERFKIFCFHFPDGLDNSGFVGWLATHLKETLGTGLFVICGHNSDRGGIFDYWACPLNLGDEFMNVVEKLVTPGGSNQDNNAVDSIDLYVDPYD